MADVYKHQITSYLVVMKCVANCRSPVAYNDYERFESIVPLCCFNAKEEIVVICDIVGLCVHQSSVNILSMLDLLLKTPYSRVVKTNQKL